MHIYDWLEEPPKNEEEKKLKEFLDFKTRTASYQFKNEPPKLKCFCIYKGEKYKFTGASSMGDVWLAKDFDRVNGYDKRVSIEDCSDFTHEETE